MTHRERGYLLAVSSGLLEQAVLLRNSAAILTEHTLLPLGGEMAEALRSWAVRCDDWAAELDGLVLGTEMES
jgi:hypothetical protein